MRYIDIGCLEEIEGWPPGKQLSKKQSPEKWRECLQKAEEELREATDGKTRSAIFNTYSDLWSGVKEYYRMISHDKCWYCECKITRDHGDMDHYRPKGRVTGTKHPGYWWLAFEWRNWRFTCGLCNSASRDLETGIVGGKGNHFPLLCGEERRIIQVCDYSDLIEEDPVLLDPTERRDVLLLTFTRDGHANPAVAKERTDDYRRAEDSIKIYHLDHSRLARERRRIYIKVRDLVADYQYYQQKWEVENDRTAQTTAKKMMKELGKMIAPGAEYSATARAYLKEQRKDNPKWTWIDLLLTAP